MRRKEILRPRWIANISGNLHKNLKWTKMGKKKNKGCEKEKPKCPSCEPPPESGCDTCPKERTHVCGDAIVTSPSTGMKMPALILGTWKTDELDVAQKAIKTAFTVGYRAIDTSSFYGNEEVLGCAIPAALEEAKIKREDIFIITKLPFDAMRCEKVNEYVCKSLAALKTPYIDLYMINFPAGSIKNDKGKYCPDPRVDHGCIWKAMEKQVNDGKVKYLGVANFNCNQLEDLITSSKVKPSNVQVEMHAYFQQKSYRRVAKELNVTVTAYAPFGRSPGMMKWLKDKGAKDTRPSPIDDPLICEISKKVCKSPGQVLLRFLLQLDDNLAVVAGASDPKMICDNFGIFDFNLDETDMFRLKCLDKDKASRLFDKSVFKILFPGVEDHPMFPWPDC